MHPTHRLLCTFALGLLASSAHAQQLTFVESGGTFSTAFVNVAAAANGATAFGESEFGPPHFIANINDGVYGNANSWLAAPRGTVGNYDSLLVSVGVIFSAPATITSLAFGRDNTGMFSDRVNGSYRVAYSTDPIAGFNPATAAWINFDEIFPADSQRPELRHLYSFTTGFISDVTAVRLTAYADGIVDFGDGFPEDVTGQAIDELEVYSTTPIPEPSAAAALAGLVGLALAATRRRRKP